MGKFTAIQTYDRFTKLKNANKINERSLNFILDTGQLYTHGIFLNNVAWGTETTGAVELTIAGVKKTLSLSNHTHSNYLEKNANIDLGTYKIVSGAEDLLYYSSGNTYLGNTSSPLILQGSSGSIKKGDTTYTILDTLNFTILAVSSAGHSLLNAAKITYGSSSFQIDYIKRLNTTLAFNDLNAYSNAGVTLTDSKYYAFITLRNDGSDTASWAQVRFDIASKTMQYRTSAASTTWYNVITSIPSNALNIAGIVAAPTSSDANKVWKTDASGNPGWKDDANTQYYLTLNGTVKGTSGTNDLGTFYAVATSNASAANQVWMRNADNNGYAWRTLGDRAFDSTSYLPLTGGTLTGTLTMYGTSGNYHEGINVYPAPNQFCVVALRKDSDYSNIFAMVLNTANNAAYYDYMVNGVNHVISMPLNTGTIALTSDITAQLAGYLPLTGGTMTGTIYGNTGNGLTIQSNNTGSWKEGIRVYPAPNNYTLISLQDTSSSNVFAMVFNTSSQTAYFDYYKGSTGKVILMPYKDGTIALTSDLSSYLPLSGGTLTGNNSWLSPARLQLLRSNSTAYTDRACIGVTDGNLHIDSYPSHDIYLNYYSGNATVHIGGYTAIHSGNIGSQSVNYANSAGSVAWDNVSGKPGTFTPSAHYHGLTNSDFFTSMPSQYTDKTWKTSFGYNMYSNLLMSVRINSPAPEWCVGDYGSGILYGGADTKGFMSSSYGAPRVMWAGGNGTTDSAVPVWYFGIAGTSGTIYNLNSMPYTESAGNADTVDGLHYNSFLRRDTNDSTPYQYLFSKTNDHAIQVGTIRGYAYGANGRSGEYLHLYERVHIGSPSGWGSREAPSYGLSTYGGAWLATDTGNVGIGTTSPSYKLDVAGDIRATNNLIVSSNNTTGGGIILADDGDIVDLNDGYASMRFSYGVRVFSANRGGSAVITLNSNGTIYAGDIYSNGVRLTNSGGGSSNVNLQEISFYREGTTSPIKWITGCGSGTSANDYYVILNYSTWGAAMTINNSTNNIYISPSNQLSVPSYKLHINGDCGASAFYQTSDMRIKNVLDYIQDIPLTTIANSPLFKFTWLDKSLDTNIHIGSSAQYWKSILPEAVTKANDNIGTLSLQYDVLALACVISIAKETLDNALKVIKLENRIKELEEIIYGNNSN